VIRREGDRVLVSGPLTLETVKALFDQGLQTNGKPSLVVDLSGVEAVDSSAVSLLLVWVRQAQHADVRLCFNHVPENLLALASLYGVADALPVCSEVSA
jgi:phospholipid transport system transporter-binding protein